MISGLPALSAKIRKCGLVGMKIMNMPFGGTA